MADDEIKAGMVLAMTDDGPSHVPAPTADDPFALIAQVVQAGQVDVGVIERLCDLQERVAKQRAHAAFIQAKAAMQADMPVIEKTKPVYDQNKRDVRYKYAPLEHVVSVAGPIIAKHGFSYAFETEVSGGTFTATCVVTHIEGHSERSSFSAPVGQEKFMSEVQKHGARSTYCKRNAFMDAFGVTCSGEDVDGAGTDSKMPDAAYDEFCDAIDGAQDFRELSVAVEAAKNAAGIAGDKAAYSMFRQRGAARLRQINEQKEDGK